MITIIDYGMGNLGSVANMLKYIGAGAEITGDPDVIAKASKLLLPGVGAFDAAMERINSLDGLRDVLDEKALDEKVPVLGICLGMQLLTRASEEGVLPGLGWIRAEAMRFPADSGLKVPHMGWNTVESVGDSPLSEGLAHDARFYFVHSYYVKAADENNALFRTTYGLTFDAGIKNDNIFGVQFHPEKSHKFGMKLLENFAKL